MPDPSPALVDTIARALYDHRKSTADPEDWPDDAAFDLHGDDVRDFWRQQARAALAALATLTPAEDPDLVRWTPQDGPLAEALAGLPDGHPVTIYGDVAPSGLHGTVNSAASSVRQWFIIDPAPGYGTAMWYVQEMAATGASWLPPGPAWDGALVVCDGTGDLFWRGPDGLYRSGTIGDSDAYTAAEIELQYGPVTVLVDADHRYVEVPHA